MIWPEMAQALPTVSVIIPAKDAAATVQRALESVRDQTYSNVTEVVVAAADSESAEVAQAFGATVVNNPEGGTPAALNRALSYSSGEIIVRCDAHSVLPPGYVERAVETLMRTGADNVGGMQVPVGESFWERSIAAAMGSRLGAGDARYRVGGDEGPVETVYLGVFRRSVLERIRGFDEAFTRTQDYELNHRIIESGGVVWFDPGLEVEYRPRGSLRDLARQYFEYGQAKRQFGRKHPGSLRWRQLGPPAAVVVLAASVAVAPFWGYSLLAPAAYLGTVMLAGAVQGFRHVKTATGVPLALLTMHMAWGIGFLRG
jgi:succinoglycan biosynthesis protein ExoA